MAQPIPRKEIKHTRDTGIFCALYDKYGGSAKSHTTPHCKRWAGAGKDHPKWRGRTASQILSIHEGGDDIKSLMAQQFEFNASIMKTVNNMSKKKKRKSKRSSRYSSSDSSDSD